MDVQVPMSTRKGVSKLLLHSASDNSSLCYLIHSDSSVRMKLQHLLQQIESLRVLTSEVSLDFWPWWVLEAHDVLSSPFRIHKVQVFSLGFAQEFANEAKLVHVVFTRE